MFITMTGDATAFASLILGYFFFWTVHAEFPPEPIPGLAGPGLFWPMVALALVLVGWALTVAAREGNARGRVGLARIAPIVAAVATGAGGIARLAGPLFAGHETSPTTSPPQAWVPAPWLPPHPP